MEQILTSESAKQMIDYVSPIYGKSRIGLWLFQVIGLEIDDVKTICEDISNDFEYFLLSYDYTFAGFSKIIESDNLLHLDTIHIHEDFRGLKIFSSLLKNYVELCRLRKLSKIILTCDKQNRNAMDCFKHLGFQETHKDVSVSPSAIMELSI